MSFPKSILRWFVAVTKPLVWRWAEAYDLRINRHCLSSGRHPVVILGGDEQKRNCIPKSVYFNTRSGRVVVGENTVFGEDVCLLTGKHLGRDEAEKSGQPLHAVPDEGRDIVIGRGCYIGSRAILIGPVTVGDFAMIGAGAVVTKDVPVGVFVGGVPAKPLRAPERS